MSQSTDPAAVFASQFDGAAPEFAVSAPGRVNLLGEHTDYNGLPVLPMALQRRVRAMVRPRRDPIVRLRHLLGSYPPREFQASGSVAPYPPGDWGNYAKAAVQGLLEAGAVPEPARGMDLLIWSDLPVAAGLSSSSALVVACALAFLRANRVAMPPLELAELMAAAERYVGTQGGGMDQATCLLGQSGRALRIDFFPLRARPVPLPQGYSVVVAHSLVAAPKTAGAMHLYNRRPAECRLAVVVLNRHLRSRSLIRNDLPRLGDLHREVPGLLEIAERVLGPSPWSLGQVASYLQTSAAEVQHAYLRGRDGSVMPEPEDGFRLMERVRHVLTEAARVDEAEGALAAGDARSFGRLMDASHASCAEDYGISTPELNALVAVAREAGAVGSRLTGAGFGGCTVSLVPDDRAPAVMQAIRERYYGGYLRNQRPELVRQQPAWDDVLFVAHASSGAEVTELQGKGEPA